MRFDENLRNLRKEKDYSQEYLAEKLGVTRQTISKWENGTAMPDLKKLIELADFFETSMDDLLGLDYKTVHYKQNNNEAEAIKSNRYINDLIKTASDQIYNKTKVLKILLAVVAIVLVITIISLSGTISSLESRIGGLENSYTYLQERINSYGGDDYDIEVTDYDIEVNIIKTYPETPYIVQAELKYAPTSYPKNSKIYYLIPKKDGSVDRLSAEENNGEFILKADIDFSIDKPIYFVLDDGENIVKQEVGFAASDIYGISDTYPSYDINKNQNIYYFSIIADESYVWSNTEYTKAVSADIVVKSDGKEVFRKALNEYPSRAESEEDKGNYLEFVLPDFEIKDLKEPKNFDLYVEIKLDNGVVCKDHLDHNAMDYPDDNMDYQAGYTEYVFTVGDKTVTIENK